jgi:BirA family biotin operon repressor/biotin-[acetyl-CoA-carboxylase] ligase
METIIGQPLHLLASVDSTNNYAMEKIRSGHAAHGTVYMALEQTAGKGQRGKKWLAEPGSNIIMSVVLNTERLTTDLQFLLSASFALGCCEFFKKYTMDGYPRIKWPNDIYWHDRKAGGILIENRIQAGTSAKQWTWSVAGIGININQTAFEEEIASQAVSLRQITGRSENIHELVPQLCAILNRRWEELSALNSNRIMEEYNQNLYKRGESVTLKVREQSLQCQIIGVDASGYLITRDTVDHRLAVGEVEWLRTPSHT